MEPCKVKYEMVIHTDTESEKMRLGSAFHEQLKGNQDYIDSRIILNVDQCGKVVLSIFEDATMIPELSIPFGTYKREE